MKKIIIILMLLPTIMYAEKWGAYMLYLTSITVTQKNNIITALDDKTSRKFSQLHYYLYNPTQTRLFLECWADIETRPIIKNALNDGRLKKLYELESVENNGKIDFKKTIFNDYPLDFTNRDWQVEVSTP